MTDLLPAAALARRDGWTPDCRRAFLSALAEGHTVTDACRTVGLSPSSAYQLRNRADGADFAIGWDAASLIARTALSDALLVRAVHGQTESVTRPDGTMVERHRFDNRLGVSMLRRLDRLAESDSPVTQAARLIAQDFEAYLDLIGGGRGPAHAGLFVALRGRDGGAVEAAGLGQAAALARAERYLRSGAGLPEEVDAADLALDQRHRWTADQWQRAEAVGLIAFAAPEPDAPACEVREADAVAPPAPVWWCSVSSEWHTHFPPPDDFDGIECNQFGDDDYERALSNAELALVEAAESDKRDALWDSETQDRDEWFAALAADRQAMAQAGPTEPPDPALAPGMDTASLAT